LRATRQDKEISNFIESFFIPGASGSLTAVDNFFDSVKGINDLDESTPISLTFTYAVGNNDLMMYVLYYDYKKADSIVEYDVLNVAFGDDLSRGGPSLLKEPIGTAKCHRLFKEFCERKKFELRPFSTDW
jgi:hypothetical protein